MNSMYISIPPLLSYTFPVPIQISERSSFVLYLQSVWQSCLQGPHSDHGIISSQVKRAGMLLSRQNPSGRNNLACNPESHDPSREQPVIWDKVEKFHICGDRARIRRCGF